MNDSANETMKKYRDAEAALIAARADLAVKIPPRRVVLHMSSADFAAVKDKLPTTGWVNINGTVVELPIVLFGAD